ncbi:MAG: MFS transporter [Lentisphaerota bacterium]
MAGLLGMVVLVGLGEKMAERFLPMYLLALGSGALWPGLLNALDNLLSALYSFPGGYLSDRLGIKRALLVFNLLAMFGFVIVIAIPSWPAVIVGSLFFLSWTAISLPATMDLVSKVLPKDKRTMGVSVHSLVRRIPMALGPIAGGICIDHWGVVTGVRIAFGAALAMAGLGVILQQFLIGNDSPQTSPLKKPAAEANAFRLLRAMDPSLKRLLVSDILIRFCEQIPYAYVVIWCMSAVAGHATARISGKAFGVLTALEMATAMLVYIPVAYLADKSHKKPFVVITFIHFTLFPLVLLFSHSFLWLAFAFILRGLKEFGEPTRKALIMDLAPEGRKAAMFGAYYLFRDVVVALGAGAGAWLWQMGPEVNLLTASAFGLAGTLFFALFGTDIVPAEHAPRLT